MNYDKFGMEKYFGERYNKYKGRKFVPEHAKKAYGWSRIIAPLTLNVVAKWRQMISFTPGQFIRKGKSSDT